MAWIESHTELEHHPKILLLQRCLGVDKNTVIGVVHRLWWWCLQYAEDGQLDRFGIDTLSKILDVDANQLVNAGFVDVQPNLRVHDWWEYTKHYLWVKYKQSPAKFEKIKDLYTPLKQRSKQRSSNTQENTKPTNLTNLNQPTLTNQPKEGIPADLLESKTEISDWLEYKKQKGQTYREKGLEALWRVFRAIPKERRRETVDYSMANNWTGLYEKKENKNGQRRVNGQNAQTTKFDGVAEVINL